jgi:DNA-binding beta-propeller fold protein YncE
MSTHATQSPASAGRTAWPWTVGLGAFLIAALLGLCLTEPPEADASALQERPRPKVAAPELDGGTDWLNTAGPLTLKDLRGRIVILDFWTLCCINCIHNLPDLAKLQAKYGPLLVILGIHTPKFDNEEKTESIRKAVLRYEIAHPVVNDARRRIWRRYGVNSWPTMVVIDPEGNATYMDSGEGQYEALDRVIGALVKEYRPRKMLNERPIRFELARFSEGGKSPLFFPGKVLADAASKRLFIADSTHHRIVITTLDGKKIAVAGTGTAGKSDGPFGKAQFSEPQGMALDGETLYVADRKNHLIRALDLKAQTVRTLAGTGEQDRYNRRKGGPALKTGMNSPWDLLMHDGKLFIAMAGHHQIWALDLKKERLEPYAGSGREDLADGPLDEAEFAQPSGLASDGKHLYVADSEISGIRSVPLSGKGEVKTIVGEGLFEFGDVDGVGSKVRLQHALGVAHRDGKLYVADTYNSKIKVIDPKKRECRTFVGEPGGWLSSPTFNEPGGLSFAGDKLYVADTNGHRIRVIDLNTRAVTTLPLQGVEPPRREKAKEGR